VLQPQSLALFRHPAGPIDGMMIASGEPGREAIMKHAVSTDENQVAV